MSTKMHLRVSDPAAMAFRLVLACALLLALAACGDKAPPPPDRPVVKTLRITLSGVHDQRTYTGVVTPRHEVQEAFRVGGRMDRRLVDVGDAVRAGQVLATLDEKDLRLSMESAQAELKAAASNRERAVTDETRYANLLAKGVASQSEYDQKHLVADEARSRLERAERSLGLARSQLGYARLASSGDGVVTRVSAEPGQVVAQGQAVVSVARQGALEVLVDIPERNLRDLEGAQAEATLWSEGDRRYRAVLRETAPSADPATRTYAVRYSLPDADAAVRLGMTATLRLSGTQATPTARVPLSALFDQGRGPSLWIVDPATGRLSLRPVVVDRYSGQEAFVHGQLAEGELVVAAGVQKLDEGVSVRLAEPAGEQAR